MEKKILIFDLDGVLINSKNNMLSAWRYTNKINNLNIPFSSYFKNIGTPFKNILKKLKVRKYHNKIEQCFREESIKKINKIKLYPDVKKTLLHVKRKNYKIGILTSKDKKRTKKILKKFKINYLFDFIECPEVGCRGKPYPDQILKIMKIYSVNPKLVTYIGDMKSDLITAKRAKINFVFAKYGYGKISKINSIKRFSDITKLV